MLRPAIHDVAIQNLPVVFALDRAGLVGADGPTHSGNYDLSYLRCIPNMVVMTPAHEDECRQMLYTAFQLEGPSASTLPAWQGSWCAAAAGDDRPGDWPGGCLREGDSGIAVCCSVPCCPLRSEQQKRWMPPW
ncbi:MAG: hypothetical protein R3E89_18355 [Thiolinea sp.]